MFREAIPIVWVAAAVILIGAEILTGTFYLLVLGISAAIGGIAAWLGAPFSFQMGLAVAVGLAGAVSVRHLHNRKGTKTRFPDNNLDIGNRVNWEKSNPDGSWQVIYRGALWTAAPAGTLTDPAKPLFIVGMQGNTLIVDN